MNPTERRARAQQIADELNADLLLVDDVKFLITNLTVRRMGQQYDCKNSCDHEIRTQFDYPPRR